jgi:hypothetical protein
MPLYRLGNTFINSAHIVAATRDRDTVIVYTTGPAAGAQRMQFVGPAGEALWERLENSITEKLMLGDFDPSRAHGADGKQTPPNA